ncbi:hypothetical protein KI688_007974 [Linnemannia hyalina]|uniref:Uncharacterized protein n=1 Tax=Linnemannia hyalina TaxID=64524 RepID=A0A9P7Y242_9FUNG|nr:hypothetical protein KI688_007974 [Linnemannia hyalina]
MQVITTRLHKSLRALLLLIPTVLVLFVGIQYIHLVLGLDYPMTDGPPTPFDCAYLSGLERMYCGVVEFSYFFSIITGFFAILEIYATFRKGPMLPKGYHQSYIPNVGYAEGVNVDYIRPPEIPMTKQDQQQLQDPHGGGGGNQQISTSDQPFLLLPPKQNTPIHASSMYPTAAPGPQPLQQLLHALPEEVFDHRAPLRDNYSHAPLPLRAPQPFMFYNIPSVGAGAPFVRRQLDMQPPLDAFMGYPPPMPPRQVHVQPQPQQPRPPSQQQQPPQLQEEEEEEEKEEEKEEEFDPQVPRPTVVTDHL